MKSRSVVGKRVVAIKQHRAYQQDAKRSFAGMELDEIVFDDGTVLRFVVAELGYDYAVLPIVVDAKDAEPGEKEGK